MSFARLVLGLEHDVKALSERIVARAQGFIPLLCGWSPDTSRVSLWGNEFIERWRLDISDLTYDNAGMALESLIDRNILIVPHICTIGWRLVPRELEFIVQFVQEMLENYEEDTRPRWVKGWDKEVCDQSISSCVFVIPSSSQDDIPSLGTHLARYHRELFKVRRLYVLTYFLEHAAASALIDRLPSLVELCDLARIRDHLAYLRGAKEAERRQSWDQYMLKEFLAADSTVIHSINLM